MVKGGKSPRSGEKKNLLIKKSEIEKIIRANENKPSTTTTEGKVKPANGNLRASQMNASIETRVRKSEARLPLHVFRNHQSPTIVPGLYQNPKYLILDWRCLDSPKRALVRLPIEPTTPRALRYERKGRFRFLDLPGEIRNEIYDLVIEKHYYAIEWVNKSHKCKSLTYQLPKTSATKSNPVPQLDKDAACRRRALDINYKCKSPTRLPANYYGSLPTALLLVCTKMHEEAASVFYSKSTFYFQGLGTLRSFLDHLTPGSLKSIAKLAIKYRSYGHPCKTKDRPWKVKHDLLWENLCERLAKQCSITHLSLDLTLDNPFFFLSFDQTENAGLGTDWIKPLCFFKESQKIVRCWVRLRCMAKEKSVLEVDSWKVRKEILGGRWKDKDESRRDAYGYDRHKKNGKHVEDILVIRLNANGVPERVPR